MAASPHPLVNGLRLSSAALDTSQALDSSREKSAQSRNKLSRAYSVLPSGIVPFFDHKMGAAGSKKHHEAEEHRSA